MSLECPKAALELTVDEQRKLAGFAAWRGLPHAFVARTRLVLCSAEGCTNSEIASRLSRSMPTVGKWRQRFVECRVQGLYDELCPGRPRSISDEKVATLLRRTLKIRPPAGTHPSVRQAADENRLSKSIVHRVFQTFAEQRSGQQDAQSGDGVWLWRSGRMRAAWPEARREAGGR